MRLIIPIPPDPEEPQKRLELLMFVGFIFLFFLLLPYILAFIEWLYDIGSRMQGLELYI